jgi:hypothetical protein
MTGHSAEDIVGQVDWEEWPDFELFAGAAEDEEPSAPPEEEDAA